MNTTPTLVSESTIGGFIVRTLRFGPDAYTASVHPPDGPPLYFGLGESAKWARFEAWRYIAAVQRQVEGRAA